MISGFDPKAFGITKRLSRGLPPRRCGFEAAHGTPPYGLVGAASPIASQSRANRDLSLSLSLYLSLNIYYIFNIN